MSKEPFTRAYTPVLPHVGFLFVFQRGSVLTYYLLCNHSLELPIGRIRTCSMLPNTKEGTLRPPIPSIYRTLPGSFLLLRHSYLRGGLLDHAVMDLTVRKSDRRYADAFSLPNSHTKAQIYYISVLCCQRPSARTHTSFISWTLQREMVQRTQMGFQCGQSH